MKKLFNLVVILLMMSFASNSLFAQNEEGSISLSPQDTDQIDLNVRADEPILNETTPTESSTPGVVYGPRSIEDLGTIASVNDTKKEPKSNILNRNNYIFIPKSEESSKGIFIGQQIGLSLLLGYDATPLQNAIAKLGLSPKANDNKDFSEDFANKNNRPNFGANFEYSILIAPAYLENGVLNINPFGFTGVFGVDFQFDNEKDVGMTCDFLGKIGVQTGYNKKIGAGANFLFGGGKSTEAIVDFTYVDLEDPDFDDIEISQETQWCAKTGAEVWLRYKVPEQSDKFDVNTAVFTRFIYSFRPYTDKDILNRMEIYDEVPFWKEEGWSFGVRMWLEF